MFPRCKESQFLHDDHFLNHARLMNSAMPFLYLASLPQTGHKHIEAAGKYQCLCIGLPSVTHQVHTSWSLVQKEKKASKTILVSVLLAFVCFM